MKTCYENSLYDIKLEQSESIDHREAGNFRVTYGKQTLTNLTYRDAAKELGECLMHALACEGLLDNDWD